METTVLALLGIGSFAAVIHNLVTGQRGASRFFLELMLIYGGVGFFFWLALVHNIGIWTLVNMVWIFAMLMGGRRLIHRQLQLRLPDRASTR